MTCKGKLRLTYCNCSRVEKCCYKLILEFLSMIMLYLHCFCTQCMPKAPQISGELHSWYSRNKPLYEDRLSVTQHNKTMVSMWAQLLKAAISKSDQPAWGKSLCTRNISPAQIFCIPFFQCSPVGGDVAENWRTYGILGHQTATCWWLWEMAPYQSSSGTALSVWEGPFFPCSKQCLSIGSAENPALISDRDFLWFIFMGFYS